MASGYPGRDLRGYFRYGAGSTVHASCQQGTDGGGGGLLKRSLSELELEQQQMIQQYSFLRSVKPKVMQSNLWSPISSSSSSSSPSGLSTFRNPNPYQVLAPPPMESEKKSTMQNQLQELERQLLDDDSDVVSVTGSTVTSSEWSDAMNQLISPSPPAQLPTTTTAVATSPSPTTSTSSSSSSSTSASCSHNPSTSRQLLLDTASAIADGNFETAATNLAVLKLAANPRGDPDQRLTAMMMSALVTRTSSPSAAVHPFADLCSLEHQTATQMLYDHSPCFKLGLMAANLAILDATRENSKIHVVDFDISQGGQYAALIYAIAERSRQIPSLFPPSLKITAISDPTFPFNSTTSMNNLRVIGDKIAKLSERLGLDVKFRIVNRKTSELDPATLGCEQGEGLAVNFSFLLSKIADESVSLANPRDELLRRVKSLEPKVVTVVEQDVNFNTAPFPARFTEACGHYGSLLDSLDAMVARDSPVRARIEACLSRKVANAVARDGADRLERPEVFGKWRARMGMAGLKAVAFVPEVIEPVKSRFGSVRLNSRFTLKEEAGGIGFGWMGRVLTVASAWR